MEGDLEAFDDVGMRREKVGELHLGKKFLLRRALCFERLQNKCLFQGSFAPTKFGTGEIDFAKRPSAKSFENGELLMIQLKGKDIK